MNYIKAFEVGRQSSEQANAMRRQQEGRARASSQLATGDTRGAQQTAIASGDFDFAKAISGYSEDQRKQLDAEAETLGRFASGIKAVPAEQREQAFMQMAPSLQGRFSPEEVRQRYQELKQNGFSDQALDGYVSQALSVKDALAQSTKANEQYTLAPGSARYDATGRKIVEQPFAPRPLTVGEGQTIVEYQPGGGDPASSGQGGSRGERNGNPGNIKDGPWAQSQPGYLGSDGTFARFAPGAGEAAQERLLQQNYIGRGINTPNAIVNRYAPPGENGADSIRNYVGYVAQRLGIGPNDPVPAGRVRDLAQAMREFETGNTARASNGPRVIAQGAPKGETFTTLSPQEASQQGLPPGPVYQRNAKTGEIKAVTGTSGSAASDNGLTRQQAGVIRTKLQTLRSINSQLSRVDRAMTAVEKGGNTGFIMGRIPGAIDAESDVFDKAVAGLSPLIRALTRVPGEGAMSDYESRLAEATLPSRTDSPEGRREALTTLRELIRNTQTGYEELVGQSRGTTPAPSSGWGRARRVN